MKKSLIISALCFLALTITAQEPAKRKLPTSPEAAFTQQFGDSEIQVAYARPLARGRKIFGGLVPFDVMWRTGASDCTVITLKEETVIGDKKMAAGKYSLFTIPSAEEWTIVLNSGTGMHGTNGYDAQKDVSRFKVKPVKTDRFYETFTIEINDINAKGEGSLNLIWENTLVKIPLNPLTATTETPIAVVTEKPAEKVETPVAKAEIPSNTEGAASNDLKAQLAPVLAAYYGLKDALVADNGKLAAENGKAMKLALGKIDAKKWAAKDRTAYESLAKKMETDAEHIGDNPTKIDHQREHFISLSTSLLAITKSLKINSETAYLQFCPMANNNKGAYWLSKDNKVKNPYFGKSMLTCGSVKETLK
jgi:Protein of unknown function (DUF2911)/Protein of unknown function (DUF3347)